MKAPEAIIPYKVSKKIQKKEEYFVQFSDEELEALNIKAGDKFTIKSVDEGILLEKYESLEFDLSEFDREMLEFLISESVAKDITISELIEGYLQKSLEKTCCNG